MDSSLFWIIAGLIGPFVAYWLLRRGRIVPNNVFYLAAVVVFLWSAFKGAVHFGFMPESKAFRAIALERISVSEGVAATGDSGVMRRTAEPIKADSVPPIRANIYGWNAQIGWIGANGGASTKRGSLMSQHGVRLEFTRINSNQVLFTDALNFAKAMKGGQRHPTTGAHIIAMMNDGTGPMLTNLNGEIDKSLGPQYRYRIIATSGQSFGEDKWMVPCEWVKDCGVERPELKDINLVKGEVIITVPKDGDMNIPLRWSSDNALCFNPDPKVLDLDCLNVEPAADDDYMKAAEQFSTSNGAYTERAVRKSGKLTGERRRVKIRMVAGNPSQMEQALSTLISNHRVN